MNLDLPPMDRFRKRVPITPELIRSQLADGPLGTLELYQRLYTLGVRMTLAGMGGHFDDLVEAGDLASERSERRAGGHIVKEWRYQLTDQGRAKLARRSR